MDRRLAKGLKGMKRTNRFSGFLGHQKLLNDGTMSFASSPAVYMSLGEQGGIFESRKPINNHSASSCLQ